MVTPDGRWYYVPSPYGFHARAYGDAEPSPLTRDEAVREARDLLARARRYNPWETYPDVAELADYDDLRENRYDGPYVWLKD